jgi:hypothetical protein
MPYADDDDIDLGGNVVGVVNVPPPLVLGDHPESDVPKPRKEMSSRNPCDVAKWDGETFTLTLTAGVKLSRRNLSDCIAEWRVAHPIINRVRVYVGNHPLVNLPIHVLKSLGFERISLERRWERDMRPKPPAPRPEPKVETKPEPEWDAWKEELRLIKERQAFCSRNGIRFLQPDLEKIEWLESKIAEEKAWHESSVQKQLDDAIESIQREIDKLQKGKS